jgi:hypothetical protein
MDGEATCIGPECKRPAARGGLCWAHLKQRERGQALRPIQDLSHEERVLVAGNAWLEAETDEEYEATKAKLLREAERWLAARGWRPPLETRPVGVPREAQLGLAGLEPPRRRGAR